MTGIVTEYLTTKSSLYVTTLIFIGCISPFIHIIYGVNDTKGIFGYTYMSSFLNAVGRINALLCASLFIKFAAKKVDNDYKRVINFGANMFLYVSCFFLVGLFLPKKVLFNTLDLPRKYYWISMIFLSVSSGYFLSLFQKIFIYSEEKLKSNIVLLVSFIMRVRKDHYPKVGSKALYAEIHDKALRSETTTEEDTNSFEEDMLETLEELK